MQHPSRRAAWMSGLLLAVVVWLQAAAAPSAHELGVTRVTVTFTAEGRLLADILVDPESLLAKLEILSGRSPSAGVPLGELPQRIAALQQVVRERTRLLFDGVRVTPAFTYVPGAPALPGTAPVPPGTAPTATLRLVTDVPRGARTFQVGYGLVLGSYALTLVGPDGTPVTTVWLAGGQDSQPFDLRGALVAPTVTDIAVEYAALGFEHILPKGLDHILFVLGLFLLSPSWPALLKQVTMFTVAHSITLGLSIYGLVGLPSTVVEPLIALSITYVAVENLFTTELQPWRTALVFGFGLLHGLGFAGVLTELGLPRTQFFPALLAFNVGVEAGQLAVIALAFGAVGWWRRSQALTYRRWVVVPASLAIAIVGAYWTVIRATG